MLLGSGAKISTCATADSIWHGLGGFFSLIAAACLKTEPGRGSTLIEFVNFSGPESSPLLMSLYVTAFDGSIFFYTFYIFFYAAISAFICAARITESLKSSEPILEFNFFF